MISVIHGKQVKNCQWTGEPIFGPIFKIPVDLTTPEKKWKGCYGSPSAALAALTLYVKEKELSREQMNELMDHFESSLRRTDYMREKDVALSPAPHYHTLKYWGGEMSLEDYHKVYGHDEQIKMYFQEIIPGETYVPKDEKASNPPKPWKYALAQPKDKELFKECLAGMPRCVSAWLDHLKEFNPNFDTCPNAVVVYYHPSQDKLFAIGSPLDWGESANKKASEIFGGLPVYGKVHLFSKGQFKEKKKSKKAKEEGEISEDPRPKKKVKKNKEVEKAKVVDQDHWLLPPPQ